MKPNLDPNNCNFLIQFSLNYGIGKGKKLYYEKSVVSSVFLLMKCVYFVSKFAKRLQLFVV